MSDTSETVRIFDVPFSCCTFQDIMVAMQKKIDQRQKGNISITNTESVYHATRIDSHRKYINKADFSCCDGVGVALVGRCSDIEFRGCTVRI